MFVCEFEIAFQSNSVSKQILRIFINELTVMDCFNGGRVGEAGREDTYETY